MTNVLWCFKEEVEADDFMAEYNEIGNRLAAMADRSGVSTEKIDYSNERTPELRVCLNKNNMRAKRANITIE